MCVVSPRHVSALDVHLLRSIPYDAQGAIAGAISMGLGEYIATKSQNQVVESDLALEKEHFEHHRDVELEELKVCPSSLFIPSSLLLSLSCVSI